MSAVDPRRRASIRPGLRLALGMMLATVSVLGIAASAEAEYATTPEATWSANNTVFAVAVDANTVYLGGKFTKLRDPVSGDTVPAGGLAALDRITGTPIWTASTNGVVRSLAVSADGTTLFAGGTFTAVNGTGSNHLAALSADSGSLRTSWQGSASSTVRGLELAGSDLYVGGQFTSVDGVKRGGLARLAAETGALETWRATTTGGRPWTIKLSTDGLSLIVGGNFTGLGDATRQYLGSVSTETGAVTSWAPPQPAQCDLQAPDDPPCYVWDVDTDAGSVYAARGGKGGHLSAYAADTGTLTWSVTADGNVQAVAVSGGLVYAGGHFDPDFAGQVRHQLAAVNAGTGELDPFAPDCAKPFPGVYALVAVPDSLLVGGGFTGVGTATGQGHYAQFATAPV